MIVFWALNFYSSNTFRTLTKFFVQSYSPISITRLSAKLSKIVFQKHNMTACRADA